MHRVPDTLCLAIGSLVTSEYVLPTILNLKSLLLSHLRNGDVWMSLWVYRSLHWLPLYNAAIILKTLMTTYKYKLKGSIEIEYHLDVIFHKIILNQSPVRIFLCVTMRTCNWMTMESFVIISQPQNHVQIAKHYFAHFSKYVGYRISCIRNNNNNYVVHSRYTIYIRFFLLISSYQSCFTTDRVRDDMAWNLV